MSGKAGFFLSPSRFLAILRKKSRQAGRQACPRGLSAPLEDGRKGNVRAALTRVVPGQGRGRDGQQQKEAEEGASLADSRPSGDSHGVSKMVPGWPPGASSRNPAAEVESPLRCHKRAPAAAENR